MRGLPDPAHQRLARIAAAGLFALAAGAHAAPDTTAVADATEAVAVDASVAPDGTVAPLLDALRDLLGVPYRRGGASPASGFDCSGLVQFAYRRALGVLLPRTPADQARTGTPVAREQLAPGDLVFFDTRGRANSHVGVYLGDARFIHAPHSGTRVRIDVATFGFSIHPSLKSSQASIASEVPY